MIIDPQTNMKNEQKITDFCAFGYIFLKGWFRKPKLNNIINKNNI